MPSLSVKTRPEKMTLLDKHLICDQKKYFCTISKAMAGKSACQAIFVGSVTSELLFDKICIF